MSGSCWTRFSASSLSNTAASSAVWWPNDSSGSVLPLLLGIRLMPTSEELDARNYWRSADRLLPKPKDNQLAPYHRKLAADLDNILGLDESTINGIIVALHVPEHRFLEKAAAFQFRKSWPGNYDSAISLAVKVGDQARALAQGDRDAGASLNGLISYFSSDILAQLFNDYAQRLPYAGFETLVDLSQGITPQPAR